MKNDSNIQSIPSPCLFIGQRELFAPVLSVVGPDLQWTFTEFDPVFWRIEISPDLAGPFLLHATINGTERSFFYDAPTDFWRVVGSDGVAYQTLPSNVVEIP